MRNRSLHRWLGLFIGAWLAWVGMTGALLALSPYLEGLAPSGPGRLPLGATLANLPAGVGRVDFGRLDRYHVADRVLTVDPPTGRVLADQPRDLTLRARLLFMHELGGKLTSLLAVGSGLLLLTGWRLQPLTRRGVLERPAGTYAWHRWLGWLITPGLGLSLITGFILVHRGAIEGALGKAPPPRAEASGNVERPVERLVNAALQAVPAGQPTRLLWPTPKSPAFVVRMCQPGELNPVGRTQVHVHPQTARVLLVEDALAQPSAVRLLHGAYPVHAGLYPGGLWLFGLGLTPSVMWFTGLLLRSRRTRRRKLGG